MKTQATQRLERKADPKTAFEMVRGVTLRLRDDLVDGPRGPRGVHTQMARPVV